MTIKIKKYNDDLTGFTKLINNNFGIKAKNNKQLVNWKFFENLNFKFNKTICAFYDKKIVGQYSNISHKFICNKENINGYICQDMCVSEKFRGQGLISMMSKKLYSKITDKTFTIGFSNSSGVKVDKNSKGYGYNIIDKISSFYFPVLNNHEGYIYEKVTKISELENINFDDFKIFNDFINIKKSKEYLKWRFFLNPNKKSYDFYLIKRNNSIIGYCVFKKGNKIYNLINFDSILEIDRIKLINTFKNITKKNNFSILCVIILENNFVNNLFDNFFKIKRKGNIYFTIKIHNNFKLKKINILDKNSWMIMGGDIL